MYPVSPALCRDPGSGDFPQFWGRDPLAPPSVWAILRGLGWFPGPTTAELVADQLAGQYGDRADWAPLARRTIDPPTVPVRSAAKPPPRYVTFLAAMWSGRIPAAQCGHALPPNGCPCVVPSGRKHAEHRCPHGHRWVCA